MYGYLSKTRHYATRFRTKESDYQHLPEPEFDSFRTVYGKVTEELPEDAPEPLKKPVTTTTFLDANLWHDAFTNRSVTAALHFVYTTPINWYSKWQATVENTTYRSELVASETATK